jgi:hypothetical protein
MEQDGDCGEVYYEDENKDDEKDECLDPEAEIYNGGNDDE